jgi:predicted nicotinamide N-methyase
MTRVEKLSGLPVVLVTEKGQVNQKYVGRNILRVADLTQGIDGQPFLIVDTRNSDAAFADTLHIAKVWREHWAEMHTPAVILVGSSHYARLLRDLMNQRPGQQTPLFDNLEDALECARLQISDQQAVTG